MVLEMMELRLYKQILNASHSLFSPYHYHQALQNAVLASQHFEEVRAMTVLSLFHLYYSTPLLSLVHGDSSSEKAAWLSCVNTNQEKMQK
ncbi:hypothetical protein [Synechocystis sp. CACIAM 05]|uniref:hypothetical protein n=1 Tax=Synechocystis sp. CACIAM 05 TaxID=1933929 RepID=UPI001390FB80|nr:hypothetical protein [Synechocystis sp. CACIAM 05]